MQNQFRTMGKRYLNLSLIVCLLFVTSSACGSTPIQEIPTHTSTNTPTPVPPTPATSTATHTMVPTMTATPLPKSSLRSIGLEGGPITALVIDPQTPTTLYAETPNNVVFKSVDGGEHWSGVSIVMDEQNASSWDDSGARSLAINPLDSDTLYAGYFRSTNGGKDWYRSFGPILDVDIYLLHSLMIDPQSPSTLYMVTNAGIYKSMDGGGSWSSSIVGYLGYVRALIIDPKTPTTLYAGKPTGIYKSEDGGLTWSRLETGKAHVYAYALAIDPVTPSILYAGDEAGNIYKSTDSGQSWTVEAIVGHEIRTLVIDPSTPSTLYAGTEYHGVSRSTDAGATWFQVNSGLNNSHINALQIDPIDSSIIYAATNDGVYKSYDRGENWHPENTGLTAYWASSLVFDLSLTSTMYVSTNIGLYESFDNGSNWKSVDLPPINNAWTWEGAYMASDPSNPATLFMWSQFGVLKSLDAGAHWNTSSTGLPQSGFNPTAIFVNDLAIDPLTPTILYAGTNNGIYKSQDGGNHWGVTGQNNQRVGNLVIDPTTPSTIYASTFYTDCSLLLMSINSGATWKIINSCLPTWYPTFLVIDPKTPTTLFLGTDCRIFKSTDGGVNWNETNYGRNYTVSSLVISPISSSTVYISTDGGVYRSDDYGMNWNAIDTGLKYMINFLTINPASPDTLYVGTNGGGVYTIIPGFVPEVVTLNPGPTPFPTPVPTWVPLPQPPLYDDFEGASLDSSRWQPGNYPIPLKFSYLQKDGVLVFEGQSNNETSYFELNMIQPNLRTIDQVRVFEAQLKVPMRADGVGGESISMYLWADLPFQGWRVTECNLAALNTDAPFFACMTRRAPPLTDPVHVSQSIPIQFGQWYTVRIEMNPDNGAIQTYLDGILVDHYMPMDASVILNLYFRPSFVFYTNPLSSLMFEIDNVRITGGALP